MGLGFFQGAVINGRGKFIKCRWNIDGLSESIHCNVESLFSGVLILVLVYTVMGTILFVSLEGDLDELDGIETAASKPYPRNNDLVYAELRTR